MKIKITVPLREGGENMRSKLFVVLFVVMMLVAACGGQPATAPQPTAAPVAQEQPTMAPEPTKAAEPTAAPTTVPAAAGVTLPEVNPLEVKGDIIMAGSSTVYPLAEAIAERFKDEGYAGNITIDSIGSGAGFERFCKAGESDIANASRKIKDTEVEACKAISREPLEVRIGTDALAVVVNPANDWLKDGVTLEELAKIYSKDTVNWSDVNPAWPEFAIKRFSPGTDSGTFTYFVESVMDKAYVKDAVADKGKGEEALLGAANLQLSEDDNVLVQGVEGDKGAIGYFGYAYFQENAGKLKDLAINGIAPTAETVDQNKYPLARPLFLYTTAQIMKDKPQVASLVNFFLTNVNEVIGKVGYFPAKPAALDAAKQAWLDAVK
jgi:phosphate transport system substrate-binding protein